MSRTKRRKTAAKAKTSGQDSAPKPRSRPAVIKYRVEIWRNGDPEFRLAHFDLEYIYGQYKACDMAYQIAEKVHSWIDSKLPPDHRSGFDTSVPRSLWDEPAADDASKSDTAPAIADEDVPF